MIYVHLEEELIMIDIVNDAAGFLQTVHADILIPSLFIIFGVWFISPFRKKE